MFRVKREVFRCPHCDETIPEVGNVEITLNKRSAMLSVGMGLGMGLLVASVATTVEWWGALGAAFVAAVTVFLITAMMQPRRHQTPSDEGSGDAGSEV